MRDLSGQIRLSATDLSNHLACHHLTSLDLGVARGQRNAPDWKSPDLVVIQELGMRHEAAYLQSLKEKGASLVDLREIKSEQQALAETISCMERSRWPMVWATRCPGKGANDEPLRIMVV